MWLSSLDCSLRLVVLLLLLQQSGTISAAPVATGQGTGQTATVKPSWTQFAYRDLSFLAPPGSKIEPLPDALPDEDRRLTGTFNLKTRLDGRDARLLVSYVNRQSGVAQGLTPLQLLDASKKALISSGGDVLTDLITLRDSGIRGVAIKRTFATSIVWTIMVADNERMLIVGWSSKPGMDSSYFEVAKILNSVHFQKVPAVIQGK
jgi:hypothetical protein